MQKVSKTESAQRQMSLTEPSRSATDIELFFDAVGDGQVKLRVIDVIDNIDVLVSEDWQNSNGDIVTDTAAPGEEMRNLRMIHLRRNGKILLAVELTGEQFTSLNLKTRDVELLFDAVEKQRFEDVKALVQKGVDVNSRYKHELTTPLHKAVLNDNTEIAEYLVSNGACIQVCDRNGNTPLHEAAHSGNIAMVDFLLANNADRYEMNSEGSTALHFSGWNEDINVVKRFIANREDANFEAACGRMPIHFVGEGGTAAAAEYLISIGANVNFSKHQCNPIHYAAYYGNLEVVRGFVSADADVQAKDSLGLTALDYARQEHNTEVVEYLESVMGSNG